MSAKMESWEAEWLSKLASMKRAISDLKLDKVAPQSPSDESLSGSEDIWDIIEQDLAISSDDTSDDLDSSPEQIDQSYDRTWLRTRCMDFASNGKAFLSGEELYDQILSMLVSDSQGDTPIKSWIAVSC